MPSDARRHIILIDGQAGAGKTTLANEIAEALDATVIHLDDVYPGWGGLVAGRDHVITDALRPLSEGQSGQIRLWDWHNDALAGMQTIRPAATIVIEGCGISTDESRLLADVVLWVDASRETRMSRIVERDGVGSLELHAGWDSLVDQHIADNDPIATATVIVSR